MDNQGYHVEEKLGSDMKSGYRIQETHYISGSSGAFS